MNRQPNLLQGQATHRRTESDYMSVLLETVTLEDWRDVVRNALAAAKAGDAVARAWLGTFLVGRPAHKAPAPLTVVVGQLAGQDPLVEQLAAPWVNRAKFPFLEQDEAVKEHICGLVALELTHKLPVLERPEAAALAWDEGDGRVEKELAIDFENTRG